MYKDTEIYVYDENLDRLGTVDVYEAFIWNPKYNGIGTFELHCSTQFFSLLQSDRIIQSTADDYHNGIIEHIEKAQNFEGVQKLIVKGRMLESILERRIAIGEYSYESMQPAQIISDLITKNAITPVDSSRKISNLKLGALPNADEGTIYYAGDNERLIDVVKKICDIAQLGFRVYLDYDKKEIHLDIYKGVNRTEEANTQTHFETNVSVNALPSGFWVNDLTDWKQVDGGPNWKKDEILEVKDSPKAFYKRKIQDRYAEYWETTGNFKQWIYFWRKAGYIHKDISLNKDHIYYVEVCCDNPTDCVLGYGFGNEETGFTFNVPRTQGYERFNCLYVPPASGSNRFTVAFGELPEEWLTVRTQYCMAIDLTKTFGVGLEPKLEWCQKNFIRKGDTWNYRTEIIELIENHNDPLVLSRDRDTLVEVEYLKNSTNERTVLYVKGDTLDTKIESGTAAEIMRKEAFINLSGIKRERSGITIPEPSYIAMLKYQAKAAMRKMAANEIIDGKLYVLSNKQFRRDFDLGDLVMCTDNNIGFTTNLRITSASESWDINGYQITVTLGNEVPDITETIKLVAKGAK